MRTGAPVTTEILGELAIACRDGERLRLQYTASDGTQTRRRIDPHAITPAERNWYLLAWDHDRDDWRTFRVDRIDQIEHTRVLFTRQDISPEEIEDRARVAASWAPQRIEGHAVMELSYEDMRAWFGPWGDGSEPEGASHTRWPIGGSDFRDVMYGLSWIPAGTDYVLDLPDAALAEIRETVARLQRALEQSVGSSA
nr:WYL domain-containing protein [Microbacterium amylolyticum]